MNKKKRGVENRHIDQIDNKSSDANDSPRHYLKSIMASKTKVENQVKGYIHKTAHLHNLRDLCVHYENNPANTFQDIQKLNLLSAIN